MKIEETCPGPPLLLVSMAKILLRMLNTSICRVFSNNFWSITSTVEGTL